MEKSLEGFTIDQLKILRRLIDIELVKRQESFKVDSIDQVYTYFEGFKKIRDYENNNYKILDEEETRKYVREFIKTYRKRMCECSSLNEFFSTDSELENSYFQLEASIQIIVDEKTAKKIEFLSKEKKDILNNYFKLNVPHMVVLLYGISACSEDEAYGVFGEFSLIEHTNHICPIVNYEILMDELNKNGFDIINTHLNEFEFRLNPDFDIMALYPNSLSSDLIFSDRSLERSHEDKSYSIFPKQKVK